MSTWKILSISVASVAVMASAIANDKHQKPDLGQFLEEFHTNTAAVMDQLPAKGEEGKPAIVFKEGDDFVNGKDKIRKKLVKIQGRAGYQSNDLAEDLVDNGRAHIRTLTEMDEKNLQSAQLETKPWSDDYWAIAKGILGARYEDPNKNDTYEWDVAKEFTISNPVRNYVEAKNTDILSPSEKYDILVGDANGTLTAKMWQEGEYYFNQHGKVETWMGICHGWAPAAYMLERPTTAVTVKGVNGDEIKFFPSDIKALASLVYAKNQVPTKFVGGRCNDKDVTKDPANGRIKDQKCFDTNPGTWHKTVVNQIAVSKRSFVIDATFDYEVWNQPVYSYSYRYFNVESYATSSTATDSTIKIEEFTKDKFKSYRSSKATKIVGVEMRLSYIVETQPRHREFDNESLDAVTTATYRYDLELDDAGVIVGGEWYSNAHPDFLWTPVKNARALTQIEKGNLELLETNENFVWKVGQKLPSVFTRLATEFGNSKAGSPSALVIEGLIKRSNAKN